MSTKKRKPAEIWDEICPELVHHIKTLITTSRVGICAGTLRILDYGTSCNERVEEKCIDRFKVAIPYGGNTLTWEIIFNFYNPREPPDFVFGPEDSKFFPELANLKSLVNWEPRDPFSLTQVIKELLDEYKSYHTSLISTSSRLLFEYTSLSEQNYSKDDVEVYAQQAKADAGNVKQHLKLGSVNFLVRLPLDFSKIPAYIVKPLGATKENPGEDTAILQITFPSPDSPRITPQLFLSPRLENALGGNSGLRIPNYTTGGAIIDYIPLAAELLQAKVEHIIETYQKRRDYLGAFMSLFGSNLLEYDSVGFFKISCLMEWHNFFFVITVELGLNFPSEIPAFTLQSVYHQNSDGLPFSQVDKNYPYSPRWSAFEMVERARTRILETIKEFQQDSIRKGYLQ